MKLGLPRFDKVKKNISNSVLSQIKKKKKMSGLLTVLLGELNIVSFPWQTKIFSFGVSYLGPKLLCESSCSGFL